MKDGPPTNVHRLAGVRELVHQRCLPFATSSLLIEAPSPNAVARIQGAVISIRKHIFAGLQPGIMLERYATWRAGHDRVR